MKEENHLVLSLDTATRCSSVALTKGTAGKGEVLAQISLSSNITHSRRLIKSVDFLLGETGSTWAEIGTIAVGLGPGSFTGLRIGLACAKGFAHAAKKQLVGVATLDALASQCITEKKICAVIDARKKQVYTAFYQRDERGAIVRQTEIRAMAPEHLNPFLNDPVVMVGDGVMTYGSMWRKEAGRTVEFAPSQFHFPSAASIGFLAGQMIIDNEFQDIDAATPLYIRSSDAELSLVDQGGK